MIVPVRAGPVFAATEILTVPLPLPGEPLVTVIQVLLLTAVHAQPVELVTLKLVFPPAAEIFVEVGDKVKLQPLAWVIVKICPLTVIFPVLSNPVFAATEKLTVPLPPPGEPDVTVIHGESLTAVHVQPAPEVTLKLLVPPPDGTFVEVGDKLKVQPLS